MINVVKRRKPTGERKGDYLEVRLSDVEKRTFLAAAKIGGLPLSAWVRERLRRAAIRDLEEVGHSIPLFE